MLDLGRVEEIRALLAAGLSQRATSREIGVSRGTVAAIFHGRWAPTFHERLMRRVDDTGPLIPSGPAAEAIRSRARHAAARKDPESIRELFARHGPPELELRPSEQAEYIEVRRKLRAEGLLAPEDEDEDDSRCRGAA